MSGERAFLIRATHPAGFRSGEWAEVTEVAWLNDRPCYRVRFVDDATDSWPIYDPADPYEFKPYQKISWADTRAHRRDREFGDVVETPEPA